MTGEVRIGTSGWVYPHWREAFYPKDLPQSRWLAYYAERFDTVELNNPFYRQPKRETFERWRTAVPDHFLYAVKLNRFVTHMKRLNVDRAIVARSYDTMAGLGPKAGVVLVQLPARFRFDAERVDRFFTAVAPRRRRHALEPRDPSWLTDDAIAVLRARRVALCVIDAPRWPTRGAVTADFVYVRFHGQTRLYGSSYDDAALRAWAERIDAWRRAGLDVFAYFNNDERAYAVRDALRLRELVG
ncbi:MAG TPA: DUF72 domain-containing protein [Candidatus Limnocylindria bacterium]|nr:DUF72 domain-containing protein [Candidatus Limnocylindria bacterium]